MRKKFFNAMCLGLSVVLLSSPSAFAGDRTASPTTSDESAVRALMSSWLDAYQQLDAKRLAALEAPDVEIIDRFGDLHLPSGRNENEKLWAENFDVVSPKTSPPTVIVEHIRFLGPDVALVQESWRFADGILLVDGDRIAPFSEIDTYVVVKTDRTWLVVMHIMQERKW